MTLPKGGGVRPLRPFLDSAIGKLYVIDVIATAAARISWSVVTPLRWNVFLTGRR